MKRNRGIALLAVAVALGIGISWLDAQRRGSFGRTVAQEAGPNRAQEQAAPSALDRATARAPAGSAAPHYASAEIEAILQRTEPAIEYPDVPLSDVCAGLAARLKINILFDQTAFQELGISSDIPVNAQLQKTSLATFLDLVLDPLDLAWVARGECLVITTKDNLTQYLEVRVYNCSDLLEQAPNASPDWPGALGKAREKPQSGGYFALADREDAAAEDHPPALPGPGFDPDFDSLVNLIQTTIEADSWQDVGGDASIEPYHGGLLVVNHHGVAHRKIEALLRMMRQAKSMPAGTVVRER